MKRFPTLPIFRSLVLKTVLVWALPRAILTTGAKFMAVRYDISPDLSPLVLIFLALGVSWVVLFDAARSRTLVFSQNLGVAPVTFFFLALGTVLICEVLLGLAPSILPLFGGG